MLELDDVGCRYGSLSATSDVSLKVGAGEIVTLIGANGAGKSSLLGAISGLVRYEGSIRFEGQPLSGKSSRPSGTWTIPAPTTRAGRRENLRRHSR